MRFAGRVVDTESVASLSNSLIDERLPTAIGYLDLRQMFRQRCTVYGDHTPQKNMKTHLVLVHLPGIAKRKINWRCYTWPAFGRASLTSHSLHDVRAVNIKWHTDCPYAFHNQNWIGSISIRISGCKHPVKVPTLR